MNDARFYQPAHWVARALEAKKMADERRNELGEAWFKQQMVRVVDLMTTAKVVHLERRA